MADLLRGEATIDQCLQRVGDDLEVIVAGWTHEPLEALANRLPAVLAELRTRYDTSARDTGADDTTAANPSGAIAPGSTVVVADLPPLDDGIATTRIADLFATPVLVVRAGGVETDSIEQSAAILGRRPFVVLNGTGKPPSRRQRRKSRRRAARK